MPPIVTVGNVTWFTDYYGDKIGRISFTSAVGGNSANFVGVVFSKPERTVQASGDAVDETSRGECVLGDGAGDGDPANPGD